MSSADRTAPGELREIGHLASWTASSSKIGNEVYNIRDENLDTFWQSDGPQPHSVNIRFSKCVQLKELRLYCSYKQDESYTPAKIAFLAGTGIQNLEEVTTIELDEPEGWTKVPLGMYGTRGLLDTYMLQMNIIANHQNGKDTHLRLVEILAPTSVGIEHDSEIPFTNTHFTQHLTIR